MNINKISETNINCLFRCATVITGSNVISKDQLKNLEIFYKIIDQTDEIFLSFENLINALREFFNNKLSCEFNENDDDCLIKLLLLAIVVYILKSNDGNKKAVLFELCDKLPLELHLNACAMFSHIIMRYVDEEAICEADLDKCLRNSDKENQMTFFSPIKQNKRNIFPENRTFAQNKFKIQQSLKAARNFEPFPQFCDDDNKNNDEDEASSNNQSLSPFIKLVNYIQSPDYQTKKLMKSNRDLGNSVNELEYQLFINSNFENELDKTINRWKDKCKTLENKVKEVQRELQGKEEEIVEKNIKIEQLSHLSNNNKRLEEKMKDYQDKCAELQLVNNLLNTNNEENNRLKLENGRLNHYYILAKERRVELENMSKEIELEKLKNSELRETRERLLRSEAQLNELQHYINSIEGNISIDNQSESSSFNTSFYNPEPMSFVVEKERDELLCELNKLKENTVSKDYHHSTVCDLNNKLLKSQEKIDIMSEKINVINDEEAAVILLCENMKGDKFRDSSSSVGIVNHVKECFEAHSKEIEIMNEKIEQFIFERDDFVISINDKECLMSKLSCENEKLKNKLEIYKIITDSLEIDTKCALEDFKSVVEEKLMNLRKCEIELKDYKEKEHCAKQSFSKVCCDLKSLKKEVEITKQNNGMFSGEIIKEIDGFRDSLRSGLFEEARVKVLSIVENNRELEMVKEKLERELKETVVNNREEMIAIREKHQNDIDKLVIIKEEEFEKKTRELMEKYAVDEEEMRKDMDKLISKYEDCLNEIDKLGVTHEKSLKNKDDVIIEENNKVNKCNRKIEELEEEIMELKKIADEYRVKLEVANTSMAVLERNQIDKYEIQKINISVLQEEIVKLERCLTESESVKEGLEAEVEHLKGSKEMEVQKIEEKVCQKQLEINDLKLKLLKECEETKKLCSENLSFDRELKELKMEETSYVNDLLIKEERLSEISEELKNCLQEINNLGVQHKNSIKTKDDLIAEENKKVNDLSRKIEELEEDKFDLNEYLIEYKRKLEVTNNEMIVVVNERQNQEIKISELEEQIIELERSLIESESIKKRLEIDIEHMKVSKEIEVKNIEEKISQKELELKDLELKLAEECEERNNLFSENLSLDKELNELKMKETGFVNELLSHDKKLSEINGELERYLSKYQDCLQEINRLGVQYENSLKTKDDLIAEENKKVNDLSRKIEELEQDKFDLKEYLNEYKRKLEVTNNEMIVVVNERQNQEIKISELEEKIIEFERGLVESESIKKRLETDTEYMKVSKKIEMKNMEEKVCQKELELKNLELKLATEREEMKKLFSHNLSLDKKLNELKMKEIGFVNDLLVKDEKLLEMRKELENTVKSLDSFKFKVSKLNLENEKLNNGISEKNREFSDIVSEKNKEIELLQLKVGLTEEENKSATVTLSENIKKLSEFEESNITKDDKIADLETLVKSYGVEIGSLSTLLKNKDEEIVNNEKEDKLKTLRISHLELENSENSVRISEMNELICSLEESSRNKSEKLGSLSCELEICRKSLNEYEEKSVQLNEQIEELLRVQQLKEIDITNAKASISNFTSKIMNLESTIQLEMKNYEKINDEYKTIEKDSIHYMNRYNDLVTERREEINNYQQTIDKLTNRIHKIEEERDDQIHQMESQFNVKIFDLQQTVEDTITEIKSVKDENIENRKTFKLIRLQLEEEVNRLQKALEKRENIFQEEKSVLKSTIEKEREETLKYKENCEKEINRLENEKKCNDKKNTLELNESRSFVSILENKVKELEKGNHKLDKEIKEKEDDYQKKIESLNSRISELEPLEDKIKQLEEMTRRLMKKLNQLENTDNLKEIQQMKLQNKSLQDFIISLEKKDKDLELEKEKMEQRIKTLNNDCEELCKIKNDLNLVINNLQEKLENVESRSQSRLVKIDNYEREIKMLRSESEVMKRRYLLLKDTNERHKIEVEKDHQEAVDNYILRIEGLTNDVASFQEQMQLLTEEKNLLIEKAYCSKRTIDEQSSKLEGLQKLVWNHTEKERRQMLMTYDENSRFTRMSHWNDIKPQITKQLPPVSRIDQNIVDSLGLNAASRLRFESYVCSPYGCEDESSLSVSKELSLPPLPPRTLGSTVSEALSHIKTPTNNKIMKKEGIRLQLTNRIRRSLNFMETPDKKKKEKESVLLDKPPLPKKRGEEEKSSSSRKKRESNRVSSTVPEPSSSSTYSLFTHNNDDNSNNSATESASSKQNPKTPKPNSVIKRLIRRSKNITPKRKHSSDESL